MSIGNPPNAPSAAESTALAKANATDQQAMNLEAAKKSQTGSMIGQTNQYGSSNWVADPNSPGGYRLNVNLSPEQQALFDQLMKAKGTAGISGNSVLNAANYGGAPGTGGVGNDPNVYIGDMSSGIVKDRIKAQTDYLNPFFSTETDQLDAKLRNQGLLPGSPAYDNAMRQLQTNHGLVVSNYAAAAQPQAWNEATQQYTMPFQMASALSQFGAPGDPTATFQGTPALNVQPGSISAAMDSVNAANKISSDQETANYQNLVKGLTGIPTAILGGWAGSAAGSSALNAGGNALINGFKNLFA